MQMQTAFGTWVKYEKARCTRIYISKRPDVLGSKLYVVHLAHENAFADDRLAVRYSSCAVWIKHKIFNFQRKKNTEKRNFLHRIMVIAIKYCL